MRNSTKGSYVLFMLWAAFSVHASERDPTCADVQWSEGLLETTPNIAEHCLEMLRRGEEWYAHIQVKIVRHGANLTIVRYRQADGNWSDKERVYPPHGFSAEIGAQVVLISQTTPGQELNVYASSQGGENFTIPGLDE